MKVRIYQAKSLVIDGKRKFAALPGVPEVIEYAKSFRHAFSLSSYNIDLDKIMPVGGKMAWYDPTNDKYYLVIGSTKRNLHDNTDS